MAKSLKDILAGVKSSKVRAGSTGTEPGVDYDPKAPAEQDFVAKHKTEVHADRVGNGDDVYKGKTKEAKYKKQDAKVYEETEASDDEESEPVAEAAECNHTESGDNCPVHGECACDEGKGKKLRLLLGGKKKSSVSEETEKSDKKDKKKTEHETHKKAHELVVKTAGHLAKKLFSMNNEEVEQIDEVSEKKLRSYVDKADPAPERPFLDKRKPLSDKRKKGVELAWKKIGSKHKDKQGRDILKNKAKVPANEEVEQIDEIGDTEKGKEAVRKVATRAMVRKEKAHQHRQKTEHEKGKAQLAFTKAKKDKGASVTHRSKLFKDMEKTQGEYNKARAANTLAKKKSGIAARKLIKLKMDEALIERHMTSAEKRKEAMIKKKTDPSDMKSKMQQQYGPEKGKSVYFATIRKKAMAEDLAVPLLGEDGKKKKVQKESGPDTPIRYPSGAVGKERDTGYAI